MADDDAQYEFKDVRAIRGTEARTIAKWQKDGWELVTQNKGTLRTEMTFRRVKPKTFGAYFRKFASQSYVAFRRFDPKTQHRLLAVSGGLVLLMVGVGVVVGVQAGGGTSEPTASPIKATTSPSEQPSEESSHVPVPVQTEPKAETYTYQGPKYEIVTVDENIGPADLNQYWVYARKFDYSTAAYKVQVKMIISDIARIEKTTKLIVQVVTDKEIIEAESNSAIKGFMDEHGADYWKNVMVPKEKSDWVAWYTGGLDGETGQPSESAAAFEILWRTVEIEKWKPQTGSS